MIQAWQSKARALLTTFLNFERSNRPPRVVVARQSRKCVTSCPLFGGVWCFCRTKTPQNRTVYTLNRVCCFSRPSCGAARERRRASFGRASSNCFDRVLRRRTRRERVRRRQTRVRLRWVFVLIILFAHIKKTVVYKWYQKFNVLSVRFQIENFNVRIFRH